MITGQRMFPHVNSVLLILAILCVTGYICNVYEKTNDKLSLDALSMVDMNPAAFYFITPACFWLASRSFLFKNANGPLMSHVKSLFYNLDKPDFFKKVVPFGSLIALTLSSLVAVYAGGALGPEAIIVNISMIFLLFASDFFKGVIKQINIENLLYIGYIFGFTIAFKTPISSFVLALEKSLVGHSHNVLTNVMYACMAIGIAMLFMGDDKIFPNAMPQTYDLKISSIFKYGILAAICGIVSSVFFKVAYKTYFQVKTLVTNNVTMFNVVPVLLGLCVAFVINATGSASLSSGKRDINEMFKEHHVYNYKNALGHISNIFLTFISGCSGGLIVPSISIGSYIGFLYTKITDLPLLQTLIIGMTSIFSAFFGYPIAASFIIQNILNQHIETLPLIIAMSYISFYSCKYFTRSVFRE